MLPAMLLTGQSKPDPIIEWQMTATTITVNTGKYLAVPLYVDPEDPSSANVEITIDWGDGAQTVLHQSDFPPHDNLSFVYSLWHEYSAGGSYVIKCSAKESSWRKTYFMTNTQWIELPGSANYNSQIYVWRVQQDTLDTPIPPFRGTASITGTAYGTCALFENMLRYFLYNARFMTAIPADLLANCGHMVNIEGCFSNMYSLRTIPKGLLDPLTKLNGCGNVFRGCSLIDSIDEDLLKGPASTVNDVTGLFYATAVKTIPAGLFDGCVNITNARACFGHTQVQGDASVKPPRALFKNLTKLENIKDLFSYCLNLKFWTFEFSSPNISNAPNWVDVGSSNLNRAVVLSGAANTSSTTYKTLNALKDSLNYLISYN